MPDATTATVALEKGEVDWAYSPLTNAALDATVVEDVK
jgi:hypothetical protein